MRRCRNLIAQSEGSCGSGLNVHSDKPGSVRDLRMLDDLRQSGCGHLAGAGRRVRPLKAIAMMVRFERQTIRSDRAVTIAASTLSIGFMFHKYF